MQTVIEIYLLNFKGVLYAYMVIQYHIWVAKWLITGLNWHLPPPTQLKPLFRLHSSHVPRSWCIDGLNRTVIHMGIYIYLSSSSPLSLSLSFAATCWVYPSKLLRIRMQNMEINLCASKGSPKIILKSIFICMTLPGGRGVGGADPALSSDCLLRLFANQLRLVQSMNE